MGGGYSLALAAHEPRLRAAVVNYGRLITAKDAIAGIHAAVLGDFAGEDQGIPPADVQEFEKVMKAAGKDVNVKIYDGRGHAFMNPGNKIGYSEDAAKDAWARIDAFFARTLKMPSWRGSYEAAVVPWLSEVSVEERITSPSPIKPT